MLGNSSFNGKAALADFAVVLKNLFLLKELPAGTLATKLLVYQRWDSEYLAVSLGNLPRLREGSMSSLIPLVCFALDEQRYALFLTAVERVVRAVEVTRLPRAPEIVLGLANVGGRVIPVVALRGRFRLPEREIQLSDHFLIARTTRRALALVVDSVGGLVEIAREEITAAENILPRLEHVQGVAQLADEMILIHDLDKFLSLEEEEVLEEAWAHFEKEK